MTLKIIDAKILNEKNPKVFEKLLKEGWKLPANICPKCYREIMWETYS